MNGFINWLLVVTGVSITPGLYSDWYNAWSGILSDVGELALIGSLYALYHQHKCSQCFRIAHMPVKGTHYKTCHKHSTIALHKQLFKRHAVRHPEQHELLNKV